MVDGNQMCIHARRMVKAQVKDDLFFGGRSMMLKRGET